MTKAEPLAADIELSIAAATQGIYLPQKYIGRLCSTMLKECLALDQHRVSVENIYRHAPCH